MNSSDQQSNAKTDDTGPTKQEALKAPRTISLEEITWTPDKDGQKGGDAVIATVEGYTLRAGRTFDDEGKVTPTDWVWTVTTDPGDLVESRPAKSLAGCVANSKEAVNRERRRVYRAAKTKPAAPAPQKATPPKAAPKSKTSARRAAVAKKKVA